MTDSERWRAPLGLRGLYEISNQGRVRRDGRILRPLVDRYGYQYVNISLNGLRKQGKVHRLVCEVFNGPPPSNNHEVAHLDGDKTNNLASNLAWATRIENMKHRFGNGPRTREPRPRPIRQPARTGSSQVRGERHGSAKLTTEQVLEIHRRAAEGETHRALAEAFEISKGQVSAIISGRKWTHVTPKAAGAQTELEP